MDCSICEQENLCCEWKCPTDESDFSIKKKYRDDLKLWEVTTCYTGPAIPANKTIKVGVTVIMGGCSKKYEVKFCSGVTCNRKIMTECDTEPEISQIIFSESSCTDEPCSGGCLETKDFSVKQFGASGSCPTIIGFTDLLYYVSVNGTAIIPTSLKRTKVKISISGTLIDGETKYTDYKYVYFTSPTTSSNVNFCYYYNQSLKNAPDVLKIESVECLGDCPLGDCCDDEKASLYANKIRRFPVYVEPDFYTLGQTALANFHSGESNVAAYPYYGCKSECEAYADTWIRNLKGCTNDAVQLERIRRKLIDACVKSCKAQIGNQSIIAASDANPLPSFESILVAEFGTARPNCSADLIDNPYPWGKAPNAVNDYLLEANENICTRLTELFTEAGLTDDISNATELHNYLLLKYKQYYTLTIEQLKDLINTCHECKDNYQLKMPFELPLFMQLDAKQCYTCKTFEGLVDDFNTKYPGIQKWHPNYDVLFSNYINHKTGFSYSYEDYEDFLKGCSALGDIGDDYRKNTRLCELPLQQEGEESEINDCLQEKFETAYNLAKLEYKVYIDEEKRKFRNAYSQKCLSVGINLNMNYDLKEYHYTLYYYDQSDNLVKTIPPEGVRILSDIKVQELKTTFDRNNTQYYTTTYIGNYLSV